MSRLLQKASWSLKAHFGGRSTAMAQEVFSREHLEALGVMSHLHIADFEATRKDLSGIFQFTEIVKESDVEESDVYAVSGNETNSRVGPLLFHEDTAEETPGAKEILSNASKTQQNHFVPKL